MADGQGACRDGTSPATVSDVSRLKRDVSVWALTGRPASPRQLTSARPSSHLWTEAPSRTRAGSTRTRGAPRNSSPGVPMQIRMAVAIAASNAWARFMRLQQEAGLVEQPATLSWRHVSYTKDGQRIFEPVSGFLHPGERV